MEIVVLMGVVLCGFAAVMYGIADAARKSQADREEADRRAFGRAGKRVHNPQEQEYGDGEFRPLDIQGRRSGHTGVSSGMKRPGNAGVIKALDKPSEPKVDWVTGRRRDRETKSGAPT